MKVDTILIVDISEDKRVLKKLEEKVGKDGFRIEQIGTFDCVDKKFPIKESCCVSEDEMGIFIEAKIHYNRTLCHNCEKRKYTRFADFTNSAYSFYYERKTVLDFIGSRRRRLYEQLEKVDTYVEGRKGLILEGMSDFVSVYDAYWQKINKKLLQKLSPLEQVVALGGKKEWTMSFIRELKMRDMEFVQTWNLGETIDFLIQCNEGYDHTPKLRLLPKRYPEFPLDQNILALFKGIGKVRSKKLLKNPKIAKDLNKLIKDVGEFGYESRMEKG